jgi:cytosol alanyl aminopeptidase
MRTPILALVLAAACSSPSTSKPVAPTPPPGDPMPPVGVKPAEPPQPPALRLDGNVRPTRYAIDLTIVPTSETFAGKVTLGLEVARPTTVVWLHAVDLSIKSATIKAAGGEQTARAVKPSPETDANKEFLAFVVDKPIAPGAAELTVNYDGKLYSNDLDGIHRQTERGEWYVFTQFESTDARRAFPCFDEPGYKVPFGLTMHVKREHVAVANAPVAAETDEPNGMKSVRFADTKPLPTYLIALAVGPFEIVDGGKGGKNQVPLRIIVPKGRGAEAAYATKATPELLALLEDYFGIPYPYEKLDQIAVPRKGGAMENAGLITYGLPLIAIPADEETIARKRRFASVAVHEIGHHWFGDLVTLAWWDDLWLNEAFASWIENRIVGKWQPAWGYDIASVQRRSGAMGVDTLTSTRKIRNPIATHHDIGAAFDGITYGKGASVIAMMETWIGPDKFQRALHAYLTKHAHGLATTADFMAALTAEGGAEVEPVFSSFLDQIGTPLVSVELVCSKDAAPRLALSQRRYTPIGSKLGVDQTWRIPVCADFGNDKPEGRACTVLTAAKGELALPTQKCPRWVNANDGGLGYYRVQYQGDLLDKLLATPRALTLSERVGVLGDAYALVEAGQLPVGKALERVPALARDQNRHVTSVTSSLLGLLSDELVSKELRPNRARFVRKVFGDRARAIGWTSPRGEDDDKRLMRPTLLSKVAYWGEDPQLIAQAKKLAEKWLVDKKAVDPDLVGLVLGIAAHYGDRAFFDRLHTAAKAEKELKERRQLLGAMASFRDPEIVKAAMAVALTDEFEARDSIGLVFGAFSEEENREYAYQFVKTNLDKLLPRLPRDYGSSFIWIGSAFCDQAHRDDAAAFFKDRATTYLDGARALSRMIERADLCIARKQAHQPSVIELLKKY